jgi:hypothetical protein
MVYNLSEKEQTKEVTISLIDGKFYVNYHKDSQNFGMHEGTDSIEEVLKTVETSLKYISK